MGDLTAATLLICLIAAKVRKTMNNLSEGRYNFCYLIRQIPTIKERGEVPATESVRIQVVVGQHLTFDQTFY